MRKIIFFILLSLVLIGCDYDVPLTSTSHIPIKNELLGLWEFDPDANKNYNEKFSMLVLKFSDTEYLIRYGKGKDAIFLRAYHLQLDELPDVLQIQAIRFSNEDVAPEDRRVYNIVRYRLKNGVLGIKLLNTEIVGKDCENSEELKGRILSNKSNKELFNNMGIFKKTVR